MISPSDAWVLARLLADQPLNGELAARPEPWRAMAEHLNGLNAKARKAAFDAMQAARPDRDDLVKLMASVDPLAPRPVRTSPTFATVADVRRLLAQTRWTWEGWIPSGRIIGVAAFEGTGKTRFLLDLARLIFFGLPWPDGQPATLPQGTRTLWLCADGHQDELAEMLPAFGLPDDAIVFPAPPDEPYEGTDLDARAFIEPGGMLELAIQAIQPGLVIIDTLTNATNRNLCAQDQMKGLKAPLVRLVQQFQNEYRSVASLEPRRPGPRETHQRDHANPASPGMPRPREARAIAPLGGEKLRQEAARSRGDDRRERQHLRFQPTGEANPEQGGKAPGETRRGDAIYPRRVASAKRSDRKRDVRRVGEARRQRKNLLARR